MAHQAGAYPGFCSIKRLGILLLPPGWDASPQQGYPSIKFAGTHLYTWVERGHCESEVSCPRTISPGHRAATQVAIDRFRNIKIQANSEA